MSIVEIFRAGRHTAQNGAEVEITAEDLAAAAKAYDPAKSEAPVVVGHPNSQAPAYGWIKKLVADGAALWAELTQLDPAFTDLVRAGRYKKISASFYSPDSPENPKPGEWYLRHVGFLGAQPPAIKGLQPVSFSSAAQGVMEFIPSDAASWLDQMRRLLKDGAVPADERQAADSVPVAKGENSSAYESQASGLPAPGEAAMTEEQASYKRRFALVESGAFVEGLVRDGKILPRHRAFIAAFLAALSGDSVVEFSEADQMVSQPMADGFKAYLSGLPPIVDFAERSAAGVDEHDPYSRLGGKIAGAAMNGKHTQEI
ncbi:MAG: phage protease [Nitrospinota bacterium]|nr:phage protease [Nitrospinota bacterium]